MYCQESVVLNEKYRNNLHNLIEDYYLSIDKPIHVDPCIAANGIEACIDETGEYLVIFLLWVDSEDWPALSNFIQTELTPDFMKSHREPERPGVTAKRYPCYGKNNPFNKTCGTCVNFTVNARKPHKGVCWLHRSVDSEGYAKPTAVWLDDDACSDWIPGHDE